MPNFDSQKKFRVKDCTTEYNIFEYTVWHIMWRSTRIEVQASTVVVAVVIALRCIVKCGTKERTNERTNKQTTTKYYTIIFWYSVVSSYNCKQIRKKDTTTSQQKTSYVCSKIIEDFPLHYLFIINGYFRILQFFSLLLLEVVVGAFGTIGFWDKMATN